MGKGEMSLRRPFHLGKSLDVDYDAGIASGDRMRLGVRYARESYLAGLRRYEEGESLGLASLLRLQRFPCNGSSSSCLAEKVHRWHQLLRHLARLETDAGADAPPPLCIHFAALL